MTTSQITCPICKGIIVFDIYAMLGGQKFTCPNCQLAISLTSESHNVVKNTMEKFEELKSKTAAMSQGK